MRAEGYTRWRKSVALLAAALLGVTYFLYFCLLVSLGEPYFTLTLTLDLGPDPDPDPNPDANADPSQASRTSPTTARVSSSSSPARRAAPSTAALTALRATAAARMQPYTKQAAPT